MKFVNETDETKIEYLGKSVVIIPPRQTATVVKTKIGKLTGVCVQFARLINLK